MSTLLRNQGNEAVQAVKAKINIVDLVRRYVDLQRHGPRWVAPCPFHQETKPSFSVNEEEGFFYCFGCQAKGDIFEFYSRINGLDFRESLEQLAQEAGIVLAQRKSFAKGAGQEYSKRKPLLDIHKAAEKHFASNLDRPFGRECRNYLKKRGLTEELIKTFGLGFAKRDWQDLTDALKKAGFSEKLLVESALVGKSKEGRLYDRFRGRLMFPIKALSESVIAFGGRIIADEDEAKYINSSDSILYKKGDNLYGLPQARKAIATGKPALLTEGYMDVLSLHQFGFQESVGVLGTALTPEQVKRLAGFTSHMEILFDGDRAGRKAALRAAEMMLARGLSCKIVLFPEGEDVDSLLRTKGLKCFEDLRKKAPDGMAFCLQVLQGMALCDALSWAKKFLQDLEIPELAGRYALDLARGLGLDEADVRALAVKQQEKQKNTWTLQQTTASKQERPQRQNVRQESPAKRQARPAGTQEKAPKRIQLLEREIITFLMRYPFAWPRLENLGAASLLQHRFAQNVWQQALNFGDLPDFSDNLEVEEKTFWERCCQGDAPPTNNEDGEFAALQASILAHQRKAKTSSVSAALRSVANKDDFASELALLHALHDIGEIDNGES